MGAGNYCFFAFISSRTIDSTTFLRMSRVTACSISGFILARTLATMSSMLGSGDFALVSTAGACWPAVSATWWASSRIASTVAGVSAADPMVAYDNMIHFYKNLAIAGGFLFVLVYGAGRLSIDGAFIGAGMKMPFLAK